MTPHSSKHSAKKASPRREPDRRGRSPKVDNRLGRYVVFFCKDCEKLVDAKIIGRKFVYKCAVCNTKNVAFGLLEAVKNFYHVKEDADARTKKVEEMEPETDEASAPETDEKKPQIMKKDEAVAKSEGGAKSGEKSSSEKK